MGIFKKAKDMYSLQKEAKKIKSELKSIQIEAAVEGMKVVVTGEQEILAVEMSDELFSEIKTSEYGKKKLSDLFIKAANKGLKKAQEIAGTKMKGIWGDMSL